MGSPTYRNPLCFRVGIAISGHTGRPPGIAIPIPIPSHSHPIITHTRDTQSFIPALRAGGPPRVRPKWLRFGITGLGEVGILTYTAPFGRLCGTLTIAISIGCSPFLHIFNPRGRVRLRGSAQVWEKIFLRQNVAQPMCLCSCRILRSGVSYYGMLLVATTGDWGPRIGIV